MATISNSAISQRFYYKLSLKGDEIMAQELHDKQSAWLFSMD